LQRLVEEFVIARGGRRHAIYSENLRELVLPTTLGDLTVHPSGSLYLSVNCRFEDVDAAKAKIPHGWGSRLNCYSGKWNFMGGEGDEGDAARLFDVWKRAVEWVLAGAPADPAPGRAWAL
jgi:hypothetical protein